MQDAPNPLPDFVGSTPVTSGQTAPLEVTALTNNIARLEDRLDTEREERLEERFRWVLVTSILFDVIAINAIAGSWLFLPVFMLQLIGLIAFAKAYGVDWAEQLIGSFYIGYLSEAETKGINDSVRLVAN